MAVGGEVWSNTSMGAVSSSSSGNSALDDNMVDKTVVWVKFVALSVGFEVNNEFANNSDALLWPSSLASLEFFALSMSSDATYILSEWNNLSVLKDIVQVTESLLESQALDGTGDFISVLIMSSQISDLAFSSY